MNAIEAISQLKSLSEKSKTFKLDMYDRAHIDDIIKWLEEVDKAYFAIEKLFDG